MKKSVSIILVAVLLVALSLSVSASTGSKAADLYYRDIKITYNGYAVTPKDANGDVVEPFIIDGTTYLPVRGVANIIGLDVAWDDVKNTVVLTKPNSAIATASDTLLYNEKGIEIYFMSVREAHSYSGDLQYYIKVKIINNTTNSIYALVDNVSLNDVMVDHDHSYTRLTAVAGKTAIEEIELYNLEERGITDFDHAEMIFRVYDEDYHTILTTDIITIHT